MRAVALAGALTGSLLLVVLVARPAQACSSEMRLMVDGDTVLPTPGTVAPRNTRVWIASFSSGVVPSAEAGVDGTRCDTFEVSIDGVAQAHTMLDVPFGEPDGPQSSKVGLVHVLGLQAPLPAGARVTVSCPGNEGVELTHFTTSDVEDREAPSAPVLGEQQFERGQVGCYSCGEDPQVTTTIDAPVSGEQTFVWMSPHDAPFLTADASLLGASTTGRLISRPEPKQATVTPDLRRVDLAGNYSSVIRAEAYEYEGTAGGCATSGGGAGLMATALVHMMVLLRRRFRPAT